MARPETPGFGFRRAWNPRYTECERTIKPGRRANATDLGWQGHSQSVTKQAILEMGIFLAAVASLIVGWAWTQDLDRGSLEERYSNGPADFIQVSGVRLHVRDSGPADAPALILVHGFGSSLHTWEGWATALEGDYRVIRLDLPGCGLSSPDPGGNYSDSRSLEIIGALMASKGLKRATLIGNSIGGRLAWIFAAKFPDSVDKLVLVSPDGFASPGFEYGRKPDLPSAIRLVRYFLPAAMLRAYLAPAYADPASLTEELLARYHDLLRAPGVRDALLERMDQTVLRDPVPSLRTIKVPVLLVWGEKDAMIPIENAKDYLQALPNATLVALPRAGHVPQEEVPEQSLPEVLKFLKR